MTYEIRPFLDKESSTRTYLVIDLESREAAIIDTVFEQHERDLKQIQETGVELKYIIETHIHADHITGAALLKDKTNAQIAVNPNTKDKINGGDIFLEDEEKIYIGATFLKALYTPGHTDSCTCYTTGTSVFTGDTLFIRGCGRTDFQEGDPSLLYKNVHQKLFTLPDETKIYPAHDYNGMLFSSIKEEKLYNPRLKIKNSEEDFVKIMNELELDSPKKMEIAVPANLEFGRSYKVAS